MTVSSDSSEMIREGEISPPSVVASPIQSHVVEKEESEEAGLAEEILNREEFHLIEEIQNLSFLDDAPPVITSSPEADPMIFQPIYYGGVNGEFTPSVTPPEPASDLMYPQEMTQAMPWHPAAPQMQRFDPDMPHLVPYPHGWGEMQPLHGCSIPSPVEMTQQNFACHAYPIFHPVPTFAGQPFFHHSNGCGSAPSTPSRGNGGTSNSGTGNMALRECYNCRRPGHLARNCGEVTSDKQCFHCLKFGHVVRNCPQARNHQCNKRDRSYNDSRMNGSVSSSPTHLEWSSDSGDPSSDCNDVSSPSIGSPMPTEYGCFNPHDYDVNPANARFYIIKSNSEQDIRSSIEHGIWCSTDHGNKKLDNSYKNHHHNGPTLLLFSVNNSGKFCGIAEMISRVDFTRESGVWSNNRFRGQFRVRWTHVKDVPNSALRHIYLANNDFKPVTFSRDTQEVPPREGKRMLYIVHKFSHVSSMLEPICEKKKNDGGGGGRSDGEGEEEDNDSSSLQLQDDVEEAAHYHQRFHRQHRQHHHPGGGGGGGGRGCGEGGEMFSFPTPVVYHHPQFATAAPHPQYGGPFVPVHVVPFQPGVEWNPELQHHQMQPLPYPAPLMAIPTSSPMPTPLQELPLVPRLLDSEGEQQQLPQQQQLQHHQQHQHSPSPQQLTHQHRQPSLSPQHHNHQQQQQHYPQQLEQQQQQQQHKLSPQNFDIATCLEEFPSLPKRTVTPLTSLVS